VYLRDETGARRFWPVTVGKIDTNALLKDRDQLFAEAHHIYSQNDPWHPSGDFEQKYIRPEQDARFEVDVWEETIRAFLKEFTPKSLLVGDLLRNALDIVKGHRSTRNQRRVTTILGRLGWQRLKKDGDGNIPWGPPDGFYGDTDDTDDTDGILGV
jgi:predicted P-loop ATPase